MNIAPNRKREEIEIFPTMARDGSEPLDRFVLCRWSLTYGCMVEESSGDLEGLLAKIPEHLNGGESGTLAVCEVMSWRGSDRWELDVHEYETLYQIEYYEDPSEEEERAVCDRINELTAQLQRERGHYDGLMRGDVPAGFDVNEGTREELTIMQRRALKKVGETAKLLAAESEKL